MRFLQEDDPPLCQMASNDGAFPAVELGRGIL